MIPGNESPPRAGPDTPLRRPNPASLAVVLRELFRDFSDRTVEPGVLFDKYGPRLLGFAMSLTLAAVGIAIVTLFPREFFAPIVRYSLGGAFVLVAVALLMSGVFRLRAAVDPSGAGPDPSRRGIAGALATAVFLLVTLAFNVLAATRLDRATRWLVFIFALSFFDAIAVYVLARLAIGLVRRIRGKAPRGRPGAG